MPLQKTTVAVAIHRRGESPIYGEGTMIVSLDDEGGGQFVTVRQIGPLTPAEISLDPEEIPAVAEVAQELLRQAETEEETKSD